MNKMNYCPNCGLPYDETESECFNCGAQLNTHKNVPSRPSQEPPVVQTRKQTDHSKEFDSFKATMKESAGKALTGAQGLATQVAKKVGETRATIKAQAEEDVKKQQQKIEKDLQRKREKELQQKQAASNGDNSQFMSSTELWSWLKQSAKRQMFYTEEVSSVSEEAFMTKIYQRMYENGVPAKIVRKNIQWDRSNVRRSNFFVKPMTNAINPLACLVQLNHVGKFTFVEEKTFIMPPDLPEVPMSPLPENQLYKTISRLLTTYGGLAMLIGVLLLFFEGGLGFGLLIAGIILIAIGSVVGAKNQAIIEHNKKCAEQEKAWNEAWQNWQNSIFLHSFQEDINGQLSRIFDSVFECIKQVSSEEFVATKVVEQEESSNINELEQLIARRKDEYR